MNRWEIIVKGIATIVILAFATLALAVIFALMMQIMLSFVGWMIWGVLKGDLLWTK